MKIEAEAIKIDLDGIPILKGVHIEASKGQFIGIIGPNGSGKSTLLKCIYRVQKPQGGCVFLNGIPIQQLTFKQSARCIGVVAQHNQTAFDFTVLDMVLMGRSPHKKALERDHAEDRCIALQSIQKVGLDGLENRAFSTLSGGERQRVMLAQALTQQAQCLILDEPTNHLDIKYQLQLMDIVKRQDITVIAAIHDLNIASLYCDYLYVMKEGKIDREGAIEKVLTTEMIQSVYGVNAKVITDEESYLHVLYRHTL